jgi:hypothetical protein
VSDGLGARASARSRVVVASAPIDLPPSGRGVTSRPSSSNTRRALPASSTLALALDPGGFAARLRA